MLSYSSPPVHTHPPPAHSGKRYFTWDKALFPDPAAMQNALAAKGRKMVTIIDPHLKKDSGYGVYQQAHEKGAFFVQTKVP